MGKEVNTMRAYPYLLAGNDPHNVTIRIPVKQLGLRNGLPVYVRRIK